VDARDSSSTPPRKEPDPSSHRRSSSDAGRGSAAHDPSSPAGDDGTTLLESARSQLDDARQAVTDYRTAEAAALLDRLGDTLDEAARGASGAAHDEVEELRLRADLTRAWITFEESGLQEVTEDLAAVRDDCLSAGRPDLAGLADMQLGLVRARSGDFEGALAAMRDAEAGRAHMELQDQARLLLNRGALALQVMQLDQANEDLGDAAELGTQAGLGGLALKSLHNKGYVEFLRGNLPRALALMEQADAMDEDVERGVGHLDRARVLLEAGLVDEAHEVLLEAARLSAEAGGQHDLGEIELDLARVDLLQGRPAAAARRASDAGRRFRERREDGWHRAAQLLELEALALESASAPRRARLAGSLSQDAAASGDQGLVRRAALVQAEALVDQERPAQAQAAFAGARPLLRSPHLGTRLHARFVAARIDVASERQASAIRGLRRAADDLGAAQRQVAGLDLRTAMAVHGRRLGALDLDLAVASGSAARVLTRTEVWRDVVRALPPLRPAADPRKAELVSRLRRLREDLRTAPPGADTSSLRRDLRAVERQVRELDWATEASAPAETSRGPLSTAGIREAVATSGATMLSFFGRGGDLYAVLVAPSGRLSLHLVGPAAGVESAVRGTQSDLGAAARVPANSPLRSAVAASLRDGLRRLDEVLLAPVTEAGLEDGPLVLVPTAPLTAMPWGMLPSRRGRPTTVARSATMWAQRHTRLTEAPRVTALAGPDVPLADEEVRAVAATWGDGAVTLSAQDARAEHLVPALVGSDIVHVAAHGEHHAENPLFSSLRLGDGPAFAHELEGQRLRSSHVVLSACEGGRISVRPGNESLGMAASLLALGVTTVVAPVNALPDHLAHETMTRYHAELTRGVDAATALATATADGDLLAGSFSCFGSTWQCLAQ
jgi:tetratricopeptide (TPR) repeat protein